MQLPNTENELWLVAPLLSRSFNLIRHGGGGGGGTLCRGRFFCLLWEHQRSWESEIFFQKFCI